MRVTIPFLLLCLLFCTNCQRYNQARISTLFQQATDVATEIMPKLSQLEQEKNSISIQGRALTELEIQKVDQINTILDRYAWFKENHQANQNIKVQQKCLETIQWIQKQILEIERL
ncbi:MAG: hypothetical protein AAF705_11610 [Bacteroidota bacterium]